MEGSCLIYVFVKDERVFQLLFKIYVKLFLDCTLKDEKNHDQKFK